MIRLNNMPGVKPFGHIKKIDVSKLLEKIDRIKNILIDCETSNNGNYSKDMQEIKNSLNNNLEKLEELTHKLPKHPGE